MALEILDRGSCQVAGNLSCALFPGDNTFLGKGVSAVVSIDDVTVQLVLVAPIAEEEFLALDAGRSEGASELAWIQWIDATHIQINLLQDPEEDAPIVIDLMFFRIDGRATLAAPAIEPPVPPI